MLLHADATPRLVYIMLRSQTTARKPSEPLFRQLLEDQISHVTICTNSQFHFSPLIHNSQPVQVSTLDGGSHLSQDTGENVTSTLSQPNDLEIGNIVPAQPRQDLMVAVLEI